MTIKLAGMAAEAVLAGMKERNVRDSADPLGRARVTIAGAGGLGSNIAIALARSGVGNLTLIDFDVVELSNLNRQQFKISQVGMAKVVALRENLREINPFVTVTIHQLRVTPDNVAELFADCDLVCEAFDDPAAKAMLLAGVREHFPDKPVVMGNGLAGIHPTNGIVTRELMPHVYVCGDGQTSGQEGLMAPRVLVCAGHQANAIVRILMGQPVLVDEEIEGD